MNKGLVVIDLQNEYLSTGNLPLTDIKSAVENAARVICQARKAGIPVFHVRHESAEGTPIFAKGSLGAAIQSSVAPEGDEPVVVKRHINAFRETDLKRELDTAGIREIVVVGAMSHMCIDAAVRAAVDMGYTTTVLHDACATMDVSFNGLTVPAAHVHAALMSAFEFGYAAVQSVDEYLSA